MAAKSDYLEDKIYNHVLRNTAYTSPTGTWIALFTATTGLETNSPSAEVSGGSYVRLAVGAATGRSFTASSGGAGSNTETWEFVQATANWGVITHIAVMDAVTVGNVLYHGALTSAVTINTNGIFRIPLGDLDITEA